MVLACTKPLHYQYQEKSEGSEPRVVFPDWDEAKNAWTTETAPKGPRRRLERIAWRSDVSPRAS